MEWVREPVRSGLIKERVILTALGFLWAEGGRFSFQFDEAIDT